MVLNHCLHTLRHTDTHTHIVSGIQGISFTVLNTGVLETVLRSQDDDITLLKGPVNYLVSHPNTRLFKNKCFVYCPT